MKVLMRLVLVLLLAGCAAGRGDVASSTTTQEETTAYKEETTILTGGDLPKPPDSTLSYGGREVKGTLGSYCWGSSKSGVCRCSLALDTEQAKHTNRASWLRDGVPLRGAKPT